MNRVFFFKSKSVDLRSFEITDSWILLKSMDFNFFFLFEFLINFVNSKNWTKINTILKSRGIIPKTTRKNKKNSPLVEITAKVSLDFYGSRIAGGWSVRFSYQKWSYSIQTTIPKNMKSPWSLHSCKTCPTTCLEAWKFRTLRQKATRSTSSAALCAVRV